MMVCITPRADMSNMDGYRVTETSVDMISGLRNLGSRNDVLLYRRLRSSGNVIRRPQMTGLGEGLYTSLL